MRIKGKYIAEVVISFDYDPNNTFGVRPFTEIKRSLEAGFVEQSIQEFLENEIVGKRIAQIDVKRTEVEIHEEEST
jgi:hypothetical protein